jgi:hypothetical protein
MALQSTEKSVPLWGGLDLKTDPKYVAPDKNLTAQNLRYVGIQRAEKRYGQTMLSNSVPSTSSLVSAGKALGSFNNELLEYDGTTLYAYSQSSGYWVPRGALTETQLTVNNVTAGVNSVVDVSAATNGTAEVYVWSDANGSVYYSARDAASGTFFAQNALLSPQALAPQVIVVGAYFWIFALVNGGLVGFQLSAANLGAGIVQQQAVLGALAGTYPAVTATSDGNIVIAYADAAGSVTLAAYSANLLLIGTQATPVAGIAAGAKMSVAPGILTVSTPRYVAVVTQPGVSTQPTIIFCPTGMTVATASFALPRAFGAPAGYTCDTVTVHSSGGAWTAAASCSGTGIPFVYYIQGSIISDYNTLSAPAYGLTLASQMALRRGVFFWLAASPQLNALGAASQQPTFFLLTAPALSTAALETTVAAPTILTRFLGEQASVNTGNPTQVSVVAGSLFVGLPYRAVLRADATGTLFTSKYITGVTIAFPATSNLQVVPFSGGALINCGLTYNYDGSNLVENGFWEFPDGIAQTTNTPGTSYQYQYFVTYEWTDALGNVTLSSPSYAVFVNTSTPLGPGITATLTLPYTALTLKGNVQIGVYRTAANSSSPAYKIGTVVNVVNGTRTVTFTDAQPDLAAAGGQRLYAPQDFTGEIDNEPAPPFKYMFATKTRVFGVPQDYPYQLWYSKPANAGRGPEFALGQFIPIETAGGGVTGLAALDTQAVVFKAQRIYYLPGDGPNAAGQPYNAFPQTLQLVASTTGCTSNPSVLTTAEGLYFQSQTGLTQLTRGVQVNAAFGMPIQPLVQALTLTGAQSVPSQNQLRWTSAQGTALVFDYVTQRWSTYTNYDAVGYQPYQNTFARLRTDGRVWFEDTATYLDNGVGVQMVVETAWLKPASIAVGMTMASVAQGFAAVWYASILGEYLSAHGLTLEVCFDYLNSPSDTVVFNATTNGNFGFYGSGSPYGSDPFYGANAKAPIFGTAYQIRYTMKRQVCESVKFKIYDTSVTGASCALNEIALQLGVIGGLKRLPSAQQV